MKDYDLINIYTKEKFTLYSSTRNKRFRFIRYTGNNYSEIVSYIKEISPNTYIWEESLLRRGTLYGYSGRTSLFEPVLEHNIRTVIANNPYLVTESGDIVSLKLTNEEALDYLKLNRRNRVFCYEDILAAFYYNPDLYSLIAIDQNHPKGISCSELPKDKEWYIGSFDKLHYLPYKLNVRYQNTLHIVDFQIDFDTMVEEIEKLKYEINSLLYKQKKNVMFKPSWENYIRRKTMSNTCLNEKLFSDFVIVVYKIVYEETKEEKSKALLGTHAYDKFVKIVGELRHNYAHGQAEYEPGRSIPIGEIYLKYLKMEIGPQCPNDYVMMQFGVLSDMKIFLKTIQDYLLSSSTIIDTVNEDYFDNVYCGKALLPKHLVIYKGLKCYIKNYTQNSNEDTQKDYPYYCSRPDYIETNIEGVVEISVNGDFCCEKYKIRDSYYYQVGKKIKINKIRPFTNISPDGLFGEVIECSFFQEKVKDVNLKPKKQSSNTIPFLKKRIGVEYNVDVDSKGRTHVGNVLIGKKKSCSKGDIIRILEIGKNPAPNPMLIEEYPFVAIHIEVVKKKELPYHVK